MQINNLGPGSFISKTDLNHAYKGIPINTVDQKLLGFFFYGGIVTTNRYQWVYAQAAEYLKPLVRSFIG